MCKGQPILIDSAKETATTGIPLLATKLFAPRWRNGLVSRPRLLQTIAEKLQSDRPHKLTLVSAPAGFGKSTLLAEWLERSQEHNLKAAWVALDSNDNDPSTFWLYFIAAIDKMQAGVAETTQALLNSPQPSPIEAVLTTLINAIHAIDCDIVVLLDDYHIIENQAIHAGLEFLLEHMPAQMHVIMASRSDPPLPLPRMRARGEILEIRVADLSFTEAETAQFLQDVMGLDLAAADIRALENRTEGWIAGLQLAALSMHGRQDIHGFVAAFAGNDRYVLDYLVEEVLQGQTPEIRSFLLQTSILERLSAPLCDAVTASGGGKTLLESLEKRNLFVISLDDKRRWYRYHHLFADVLRAHLSEEQPQELAKLHQRAAAWYAQNNFTAEAIQHSITAGDFERAAELVECAAPALFAAAHSSVLYRWLDLLPKQIADQRPVLSAWRAWSLMDTGCIEEADERLRMVESWLEARATEGPSANESMVVADSALIEGLPAMIAAARAMYSQAMGQSAATEQYARQALKLLKEEDHVWRGGATALLGLAAWSKGDLALAYRSFADGLKLIKTAGSIHFQCSGTHVLADILIAQGRLREAQQLCRKTLDMVAKWNGPAIRGTADVYLELADISREHNDMQTAAEYLQKGRDLGEPAALSENRYRWPLMDAMLLIAGGDLKAALLKLEEAESLFVRDAVPYLRPLEAVKAQLYLRMGRLSDAKNWVAGRGLTADDELHYIAEFELLVYSRVLIEQYRQENDDRAVLQALRLLEALLKLAEGQDRAGSVLEISLVLALAHQAKRNMEHALPCMQNALNIAEREAYVRIFLDEGPHMLELLMHCAANEIGGNYTRRILTAGRQAFVEVPASDSHEPNSTEELNEALTNRELEILRLIASGTKNQDIADLLYISVHTVKRHIANAYGKLGVKQRSEAIARANSLDLL